MACLAMKYTEISMVERTNMRRFTNFDDFSNPASRERKAFGEPFSFYVWRSEDRIAVHRNVITNSYCFVFIKNIAEPFSKYNFDESPNVGCLVTCWRCYDFSKGVSLWPPEVSPPAIFAKILLYFL